MSKIITIISFWHNSPQRDKASPFSRFLYHIQRRTTVGRTPVNEWSASRRDLYLTKHNTHNRQTSIPPAGFEPLPWFRTRNVFGTAGHEMRSWKIIYQMTWPLIYPVSIKILRTVFFGSIASLLTTIQWSGKFHLKIELNTGCPRRKGQNFGIVCLMLNYTDITQNTYNQSWTVTEIMAREFWNFDSCYTLTDYQIHIKTGRNMWFL